MHKEIPKKGYMSPEEISALRQNIIDNPRSVIKV